MISLTNYFPRVVVGVFVVLILTGCATPMPTGQLDTSSEAAACAYQDDSKEEKVCISNQAGLAEKRMLTYLQAARRAVEGNESLMQQIDESQTAWVNYRKEQCDNDSLWARVGGKAFSFRQAMQCQLDLTLSRTHDIWAVYLSRNPNASIRQEPHFPKNKSNAVATQ